MGLGETHGAFVCRAITEAQLLGTNITEATVHCDKFLRYHALCEIADLLCKLLDRIHDRCDERTILQGEVAARAGADRFGDRRLHILCGEAGVLRGSV